MIESIQYDDIQSLGAGRGWPVPVYNVREDPKSHHLAVSLPVSKVKLPLCTENHAWLANVN